MDRTNITIDAPVYKKGETPKLTPGVGSSVASSHSRLHDITSVLDHAPVAISYRNKWLHTNAITGNPELIDIPQDTEFQQDINRYGFLNQTETAISFDPATFVFTLTSTNWFYYRIGLKYEISGNKTIRLTPTGTPPAGRYYIYIDATDGTLSVSNSGWTLLDTKVPVAIVAFNDALTPKYILSEERHTVLIDRRTHFMEHYNEGTKWISGALPSGYTLNSDVDANKTVALSTAMINDEDIVLTLAELLQPNGNANAYWQVYKDTGVWVWETNPMPFRYTASGYIQYNNAGTMTEGATGKAYNTYLFLSNAIGDQRFMIISGQSAFANAAAAYLEDFGTFDLAGLPVAEGIAVYQFTWTTLASYNSKGKCVLNRVKRINTNVTNTTQVVSTNHNTLTGIQGGTSDQFYHLTAAEYGALITGSGTENYLPKITATGRGLTNSQIFDNGSNIGVGKNGSFWAYFDVVGNGLFGDSVAAGTYIGYNKMGNEEEGIVSYKNNDLIAGTKGDFFKFGGYDSGLGISVDVNSGYIGLLTEEQTRTLDINGALRIRTLTEQTGYAYLLVSDANGNIDIINKSTFLTTEADTLDSVTDRGATTTNGITIGSVKITTGATVGYYLSCTNVDGTAQWTAVSSTDVYKGTWDASTNTPTLADGTGTAGWWYRCVVGGTVNFGAGNITFSAGDDVAYNGTIWQKRPGAAGYTLPTATDTVLGGVKIGSNVSIASGVISVHNPLTIASGSASSLSLGTGATAQELTIGADLNAIEVLSGTSGFLTKTGINTWALDTNTYLTSQISHTDVVVDGDFTSEGLMRRGASSGVYSIVTDNSTNWNTAYGWGDHDGLYLPLSGGTLNDGALITWQNTASGLNYKGTLAFTSKTFLAEYNDVDASLYYNIWTGNEAGVTTFGKGGVVSIDADGKLKVSTLQVETSTTAGYVLTADSSGNATWQASANSYFKRTGTLIETTTAGDRLKLNCNGSTALTFESYAQGSGGYAGYFRANATGTGYAIVASTNDQATSLYSASVSGTAGHFRTDTGLAVIVEAFSSNTNSSMTMLQFSRQTSGTAAAGIGAKIDWWIENGSGGFVNAGIMDCVLTTVTGSGEISKFTWSLINSGAVQEKMSLSSLGELSTVFGTFVAPDACAREVIHIEQGDADMPFIEYYGTSAADQTKSISTQSEVDFSYVGCIRIRVNNQDYWFKYFTEA